MTRQAVLDLYFVEARSKLLDLAAFMDRVERAEGNADFRWESFVSGVGDLDSDLPWTTTRVERILKLLSDPTTEPLPAATTKSAAGAWPGYEGKSHIF